MSELQRIVTIIPAKPKAEQEAMKRKLQVAAYCRVSTEEEEQQSSYEAQCSYYTDKIMTNPEWTMAGIFADEGITGTSTKNRDDFNRMIRKCKKGKINLILTKSISRFARNTLDTIKYTRMLRAMGIGIYFEKLKGSELPPVDIIAGGSPCQDLSVASTKRLGLSGERSGLFMEQIRIVITNI